MLFFILNELILRALSPIKKQIDTSMLVFYNVSRNVNFLYTKDKLIGLNSVSLRQSHWLLLKRLRES